MIVLVALAYIIAMKAAAKAVHYDGDLTGAFLGSLVPITLAYVVAHYLVLRAGGAVRGAVRVRSFGFGWNLFGTADVSPTAS